MKNRKKIMILISIILIVIIGLIISMVIIFPIKDRKLILNLSKKYGISENLIACVINIESGYNENAKSKSGAIGIMQLMPSTAFECAEKLGMQITTDELYDKNINAELGCFYLKTLLTMFDHNVINALASYNWGYNNVKSWILKGNKDKNGTIVNIPIKETEQYIKKYKINKAIYSIYGYKVE